MAAWRQNEPNNINRDPDSQRAGSHLRSAPIYAPAERSPNQGAPSRYTPFGLYQPEYASLGSPGGRAPYAARWDGLGGELMDVPQADLYDSSRNPWPGNGVYDQPSALIGLLGLLRLQPTTSAHPGATLPPDYSPTTLFHAPPVFSLQTKPILAVGL
jgi:hypothetical protein